MVAVDEVLSFNARRNIGPLPTPLTEAAMKLDLPRTRPNRDWLTFHAGIQQSKKKYTVSRKTRH